MTSKRALVVDDSRAARQILGRMLESFGLEVESVESAELALSYLQTARPDVIFMDHLMSGMDGFAAVRVLKANPDTATIPVLMYTSQEGEVYLSQARALGAMGVLPKTLKHADVANVLQQLHLMPGDPPTPLAGATPATRMAAPHASAAVKNTAPPAAANSSSVAAQQLAQRIVTDIKAELANVVLATADATRDAQRAWLWWRIALAILSCALLALTYSNYQLHEQLGQLAMPHATPLVAPATAVSARDAEAATTQLSDASAKPALAEPHVVRSETEAVPYGEVPLAGTRLEHLRALVDGLRAETFKGVLRVEVFTGDFCLSGNASGAYHVAEDELPIKRCDLLGNPFADALNVQQRQSVAFANFLASVNQTANTPLRIQLADGGRQLTVPYPAQSATLLAADWNRSAERNNRVEFTATTTE